MPRTFTRFALTAAVVAATALGPFVAIGSAAQAAPASCRDTSVGLTVEERRLQVTLGGDPTPVPERILVHAGFDRDVSAFERALCRSGSVHSAGALVDRLGADLWEHAVARVRTGADGYDDRPLYWARVSMTAALRQWTPRFSLGDAERAELERRFEYASRGLTSSRFLPVPGVRKVFVSGFDPFTLDSEIRRSNPAGSSVLRLDGRFLVVGGRLVQIQAVVFPVRYTDFDNGIVEDAFQPHLAPGPQQADLVTTVSQGRPGRFDLEVHNGRRRDVQAIGDNNNVWGGGTPTAPVVFPGVGPGPEFIDTTLPVEAMRDAVGDGTFPVNVNTSVVEIPAGASGPVVRPGGPTPGSIAVEGGGGGYLSNETAYRDVRLRDELGVDVPAGHVHTPVLYMDPANAGEISDPVFEGNRAAIGDEYLRLLRAGIAAAA